MAYKNKGIKKMEEMERDTTLAFIKGQFLTINTSTGKVKPITANTEYILGIALESISDNDVSTKTSIGFERCVPDDDELVVETTTSITSANIGQLASFDNGWSPTTTIPVKVSVGGVSKAQFRVKKVLGANLCVVVPIGALENYTAQTVA